MKVFGTEMYLETFIISSFEILMLFFAFTWYLMRTSDKNRLHYLVLLYSLIQYNVVSGLFPDDQYNQFISRELQLIIAYAVGFITSLYFGYYFYRVYDLKEMKWIVFQLAFFLLVLPFFLLFVLPYLLTGDLTSARKLTVILPFAYGVTFIVYVSKSFYNKFIKDNQANEVDWVNLISVYLALLFWCTLPIIVFFGDFQVLEAAVTNAGFMLMTIVYIRSSIVNSNREYSYFLDQTKQVEQLESQLSNNKFELSKLVLRYTQGTETLENLKDQFFALTHKERSEFPQLVSILKNGVTENNRNRWEVFFESFDKAHNGFYEKVKSLYPQLTEQDYRLLVYAKLNLETEEIASLFGINGKSVRQKKYRLKQKIGLGKEQELNDHLHQL